MPQPGKSARRTRSGDSGENHGQTRLAHDKREDECASTWAAATHHSRMRDRHHAHHCASEISPRRQSGNTEVPTHQHTICRDAEVPSSTQSAPYLPLGLIRMRIEQIRESPLGLDPRAAELPNSRYVSPWYAQYPKRQGDVSPHTPSPLAGLLMAPLSVSSHGVPRLSGI